MEQQQKKQSKEKEMGALWLKKSKAGNNFMSGYVVDEAGERQNIVVFKNNFKQPGELSPDYRIYLSNTGNGSNTEQENKTKETSSQTETSEELDSEEIPF